MEKLNHTSYAYKQEQKKLAREIAKLGGLAGKIPVRIDCRTIIYVTKEKFEKLYKK